MAPHSSTLAWKIPWTEEPDGLQSTRSLWVGYDWAISLSLSCIGGGNGNPLQYSCLENPREGGAWWAAIYGVSQSQTQLKWLSSSSIQSAKIRPGANCGSDHDLLIVKFRFKLKKVGKTTRPFRYDLSQISHDYTVEMTNRIKGLDLVDRVPEELWMEVRDIVQEAMIKTIPKKKKCKKAKRLLRRPYTQLRKEEKWKAKEKTKDIPISMQSSKE